MTSNEQRCGTGFAAEFQSKMRSASFFTAGFIRAPIPIVKLSIWSGAQQVTNGGTLQLERDVLGARDIHGPS